LERAEEIDMTGVAQLDRIALPGMNALRRST
jgi:hypothetical protein